MDLLEEVLEDDLTPTLDPHRLQVMLKVFLRENARPFTLSLWKFLLSSKGAGQNDHPTKMVDTRVASTSRYRELPGPSQGGHAQSRKRKYPQSLTAPPSTARSS
jgi:hypothetical protein